MIAYRKPQLTYTCNKNHNSKLKISKTSGEVIYGNGSMTS